MLGPFSKVESLGIESSYCLKTWKDPLAATNINIRNTEEAVLRPQYSPRLLY